MILEKHVGDRPPAAHLCLRPKYRQLAAVSWRGQTSPQVWTISLILFPPMSVPHLEIYSLVQMTLSSSSK